MTETTNAAPKIAIATHSIPIYNDEAAHEKNSTTCTAQNIAIGALSVIVGGLILLEIYQQSKYGWLYKSAPAVKQSLYSMGVKRINSDGTLIVPSEKGKIRLADVLQQSLSLFQRHNLNGENLVVSAEEKNIEKARERREEVQQEAEWNEETKTKAETSAKLEEEEGGSQGEGQASKTEKVKQKSTPKKNTSSKKPAVPTTKKDLNVNSVKNKKEEETESSSSSSDEEDDPMAYHSWQGPMDGPPPKFPEMPISCGLKRGGTAYNPSDPSGTSSDRKSNQKNNRHHKKHSSSHKKKSEKVERGLPLAPISGNIGIGIVSEDSKDEEYDFSGTAESFAYMP